MWDGYGRTARCATGDQAPCSMSRMRRAMDSICRSEATVSAITREAALEYLHRQYVPNNAVVSAAGAIEHLRMTRVAGLPKAMARLADAGVWTVGLDVGGDAAIHELTVADQPVALVLGAEGSGLSRLVRERCDTIAYIPLGGVLGSLNVSAAAAIALFEVARRRS